MTALSLSATAAEVGLSYDRFRKVWPTWTRERGFPAPFSEPGDSPRWEAAAVAAWKADRSALNAQALARPAGRVGSGGREPDDRGPMSNPSRAVARDRNVLKSLMAQGA